MPSDFPVLSTTIDTSSESYLKCRNNWNDVLSAHDEALKWCLSEGDDKYINRHIARGMLLSRDRINMLLDRDTPFLELCIFAGYKQPGSSPSASIIAGIGIVSGIKCMITSSIPTIDGGASNAFSVSKGSRIAQISELNNLPTIALLQTAGASLPQQFRVFHTGGSSFRSLAKRSELGTPSCTVVFGSSTAGGAYAPGMSDYTIFVEKQAQVFLGGPPLVKMATGEVSSAEELGGAEMHSRVSGLADQIARNEFEGIEFARRWVKTIRKTDRIERCIPVVEPLYSSEELLGIIPTDIRQPLDMREVLLRLVDGSRMDEFKALYGVGLITAWAHIHGHLIGIIANQTPVIFTKESQKAVQFIRLCNQSSVPILFMHNVTGFMVGQKTEREGLVKSGSLFVDAVSRSKVSHLSIICGASYGAGNYAMCGRAYEPRFLFSWPVSKCSVMGPDQLTGVMTQVSIQSALAAGKKIDQDAIDKRSEGFKKNVHLQSIAYYTSSHVLDDGVIDPRDTRDVLGMCLEIVSENGIKGNPGFGGVSRL